MIFKSAILSTFFFASTNIIVPLCYLLFGDNMKVFKSKRVKSKKRKRKIRLIIFTFFFIFSYVFMVRYLKNNQLKETILQEDVNYIKFDIKKETVKRIDKVINNPVSLLNKNVKNARENKKVKNGTSKVMSSLKSLENNVSKEKVEENKKEPFIYIYNTHQTENYLDYTVYDAAYLLNQKLNESNFYSYFEEQSVKTFLDANNLKYYSSYKASRKYLDEARKNNLELKYFFDIHRDSVSKNVSTVTYKDKVYAKILFVIGSDNPSNEKNKNNASRLNEIIKSKVPNISRGVVSHGGKGYNGVYNQDVSENVFLIEVGGKDNSKEEVENTINIIYESIMEYIRGVIWLATKKCFMVLYGFYS